eukprot:TRINITY_DN3269_c0_g1_i1.p2 TRINITY_DN3269_c0_g1~~TRINITY_DN3269_c0_g1_i1.p2  ORF type:complete len:142 (+),score=32.22 TRINITY_DN3269_c0_g1_i1:3-428(+)
MMHFISYMQLIFFFSSRRRHTRFLPVSWARRCVQETAFKKVAQFTNIHSRFCFDFGDDEDLRSELSFSYYCYSSFLAGAEDLLGYAVTYLLLLLLLNNLSKIKEVIKNMTINPTMSIVISPIPQSGSVFTFCIINQAQLSS